MKKILLGATALLLLACCNGKSDNGIDYGENKEYLRGFEKTVEKMTVQQKQSFIIDGEEILEELQNKVESDSIDPETRFHLIRSIKLIQNELAIVRNSL